MPIFFLIFRFKCPFHGMIVARDETGKCVNPTDAERDKIMELKRNNLDVQNPELLAEIKVAFYFFCR